MQGIKMTGLIKFQWIVIALIVAVIFASIAYYFYNSETDQIRIQKIAYLDAITNLKIDQITKWRTERLSEAHSFPSYEKVIYSTRRLLKNRNDEESNNYLNQTLRPIQQRHRYQDIFIAGLNEDILFSLNDEFNTIDMLTLKAIRQSIANDSIMFNDFYYCKTHSKIHLDIISPIKDKGNNIVGVMVLRFNPRDFLYPLIQKWPTPSQSAECIIVTDEDTQIRILSDVRYKENAALRLVIPKSDTDHVAVKAFHQGFGIIEGIDYRQHNVLASVRKIEGTNWTLVSKIDEDEIFQDLDYRSGVFTLITLIAFLFLSTLIMFLYKNRQSKVYKNLFFKERELNLVQSQTKAITDSAHEAIIIFDENDRISFWNPAAEIIFGYNSSEVNGKGLYDIIVPTVERNNFKVIEDLTNSAKSAAAGNVVEFITLRKDGVEIHVEMSLSAMNSNGNCNSVGIIRDISERKKIEADLKESQQNYHQIIEGMKDAVYVIGFDGKIIDVNQAAVDTLNYTREEFLSLSPYDIDDSLTELQIKQLIESMPIERFQFFQTTHISKDRRKIPVEINTTIIRYWGEEVILCIARDITERKVAEEALLDSEERFRSIVMNAPDGIFIQVENKFVFANPFLIKLLGYSNEESLLGKQVLHQIHPDYQNVVSERINQLNLHRQPVRELKELKFLKVDRSELWVETKGEPIVYNGNNGALVFVRDITDRKTVEEALLASEERWQFAIEGSDDGVWDWNINTNEVFFSSRWKQMLGYNDDDIKAELNEWKNRIHPDDLNSTLDEIQKHLEGETTVYNSEHRLLCKDGTYKWMMDRGKILVKNEDGSPARMVGTHKDITQRRNSEEALKESEEKYRLLFESLQEGFALHEILLDDNGNPVDYKFLVINRSFENITGLKSQDLIGKTIKELLPTVEDFWIEVYGKVALTGEPVKIERFFKEFKKYYRVHAYSPAKYKFATIAEDITEIKKSEMKIKQLSVAVEQSPATVVITNKDGIIEYVNPKFTELTQYTLEDVKGKNPSVLKSGHTSDEDYNSMWNTIISGNEWTGTFLNKKKDGKLFWESARISPLRNSDGTITHFVAIKEDITQRIETEKELNEHRENLEAIVRERTKEIERINSELVSEIEKKKQTEILLNQSLEKEKELNQLKSRFISTASHEFRTPLTTILSSAELIQRYGKRWEEEKYLDHLQRITNSVDYLTTLMDDVLTVSRVESGKVIFAPAETNLRDLCNKVIADFNFSDEAKHKLKFNYLTSKSTFNIDQKQVQIIIQNLLSNAFKYSINGNKVELKIDADDSTLQLRVTDHGIGISDEDLGHIFDPFYRSINTEGIQGTGLGLSIVKNAVEMHGGTISVNSKLGEGTTFLINIPLGNK